MKAYVDVKEYLHSFLTSTTRGTLRLGMFNSGENASRTRWIGLRAGFAAGKSEKFLMSPGR